MSNRPTSDIVEAVDWWTAMERLTEQDEVIATAVKDRMEECRVYWGSHGCALPRGHDGHHDCGCCTCANHPDLDSGCVGRFPFYGPETHFYGEDMLLPPPSSPSA